MRARWAATAAMATCLVVSACTSGGSSGRAVSLSGDEVATCSLSGPGNAGRAGQFVYLSSSASTNVHTRVGVEVVVHPQRGEDAVGWRLHVLTGARHVCRLTGDFVPSVIQAFIAQSVGTTVLDATAPDGTTRHVTINASAH